MNKLYLTSVFASLTLFAVLAALLWLPQGISASPSIDTVRVERRDLAESIELLGKVINDRTVTITALLDGQITRMNAHVGDAVGAGATLAMLDVSEATVRLARAKAELELARRRLQSAERDESRQRSLSKKGIAARQTIDEAQDALDEARLTLAVAEFDVMLLREAADNAVVDAPFAGTVIAQHAESGQWVEAGTPLFTLVASDGIVIEADVDAGDSALVTQGLSVRLSSDAWPDHTWRSRINWVAPNMRGESTNRFAIRLPLGEDAPPLKLGQRVDLAIETHRVEQAATLPLEALIEDAPGRYHAFAVDGEQIRRVELEVGLVTIDTAEILTALANDTRIILPGDTELEDGMSIRQALPRDPS